MKEERIRKIMISAMKQSLKATLPVLNPMVDIKTFMQREFEGEKFIAHCYKDQERIFLKDAIQRENQLRSLSVLREILAKRRLKWLFRLGLSLFL